MKLLGLAATILAGGTFAWAKPPAWFNDGTRLEYPRYSVTCSASGPSLDQARKQAISICKSSAMDQLPTKTKYHSVIIETERDLSLHAEAATEAVVKNLRCNPRHEEIVEAESSYTAYLMCDFDLSKTELTEAKANDPTQNIAGRLGQFAEKSVDYTEPIRLPSNSRSISISTAPQCQDILIRGKRSRIIRCTENPISIILAEDDSEVVIRKNGFRTKKVEVVEMIHSKEENFVFPLDPL